MGCADPPSFASFRLGRNSGKGSSLWCASENFFGGVAWRLIVPAKSSSPEIPPPRGWPSRVESTILHVMSLAFLRAGLTESYSHI